MMRTDQSPGRGSGSSCRDRRTPASVGGLGCEPNEHTDGQDPRRGSQRHDDDARKGDAQPEVPHSEGPDSHSPVFAVLQFRRVIHVRDCCTMVQAGSLVVLAGRSKSVPG